MKLTDRRIKEIKEHVDYLRGVGEDHIERDDYFDSAKYIEELLEMVVAVQKIIS